jgi:hypothetical protein
MGTRGLVQREPLADDWRHTPPGVSAGTSLDAIDEMPSLLTSRAILDVAGLSLVTQDLALPIFATAVLLYAIPGVWSRIRDGKRKEAMRMNGDSVKCVVLKASAYVGSGFITNAAAAAVPG